MLQCLDDLGVHAEGIEISAMARDKAPAGVRERIHHGDLLRLDLPSRYDLLFGLDIFEHLNPNRLDAYISRIAAVTTAGARLFCNIPAFGRDAVFGTVFPFYIDGWEAESAAGVPFTSLEVDALGYPIHGHLTWADASWWTRQFEKAGFRREFDTERRLHTKYDGYFDKHAPARKSFFVFAKSGKSQTAPAAGSPKSIIATPSVGRDADCAGITRAPFRIDDALYVGPRTIHCHAWP